MGKGDGGLLPPLWGRGRGPSCFDLRWPSPPPQDIDIKKVNGVPQYAFLQYCDIASVCKAIKKMDGEYLGNNRLKVKRSYLSGAPLGVQLLLPEAPFHQFWVGWGEDCIPLVAQIRAFPVFLPFQAAFIGKPVTGSCTEAELWLGLGASPPFLCAQFSLWHGIWGPSLPLLPMLHLRHSKQKYLDPILRLGELDYL